MVRDRKLIREIVRLCIKFHSMPLKGNLLKLPRDEISYEDLLIHIKKRYDSLGKLTSNKEFIGIADESYENLRSKSLTRRDIHPLVLGHGDICEQNLIIHREELKLIDFEGLGLTEPAAEIAYIFTQFGEKDLGSKEREIFLEEYIKLRKDSTLRERVNVFMPLKNFSDLLWAVGQALKIKNRLLHEHYLESNSLKDAVAYAQKVFGRCVVDKTIDKKYKDFDLNNVLK